MVIKGINKCGVYMESIGTGWWPTFILTNAYPGPKFLNFHAVFGKNFPNSTLAPTHSVAGVPGESWIRHCSKS